MKIPRKPTLTIELLFIEQKLYELLVWKDTVTMLEVGWQYKQEKVMTLRNVLPLPIKTEYGRRDVTCKQATLTCALYSTQMLQLKKKNAPFTLRLKHVLRW